MLSVSKKSEHTKYVPACALNSHCWFYSFLENKQKRGTIFVQQIFLEIQQNVFDMQKKINKIGIFLAFLKFGGASIYLFFYRRKKN
jgi:hypothetical protein